MTTSIVVSIGYTKFKVPSHWSIDDVRSFIGMAAELSAVDYHYDAGKHYHYSRNDGAAVTTTELELHTSREAAERAAKRAAIEKQLNSGE